MTGQARRRGDDRLGALLGRKPSDVSQDEIGRLEAEAGPGLVARQAAGQVRGIDPVGDDRGREIVADALGSRAGSRRRRGRSRVHNP